MLKLRLIFSFLLTGAMMLAKHFAEINVSDKSGKLKAADQIRHLGLAYREDTRSVRTGRESSTGFTGNVAWQSDSNGFTTPILGDAARLALDFLRQFKRIIFDYPQSRMIFVPKV
ncbi:MAG: hypothetical protein HKL92_02370 [Candidatus Eremiobacteraeota bacterium]|nr:hypothetical protein [Candidatus Eremiobacteraeota bacterium]NNM92165.1 hypothetical protein [Candidatus Eremiobacteraeota bacterium]